MKFNKLIKKEMPIMKYKKVMAGLVGCILSATASASLIYDSSIQLTGQGFGAAPRDLTIQATGNSTSPAGTESGCVGVSSSGGIVIGSAGCTGGDATHAGNGVIPFGGDEPQPDLDGNKYGIPTIGSLDITTADQIAILFNATEPGGDSAFVTDLTLKFYSATGTFLGAIDGQHPFASTEPGVGVAGFVFVVDEAQQAFVDSLLLIGGAGTTLALESTITGVAGGPETFLIFNLDNPPNGIPEPAGIALFGIALLGGLAASRKRSVRDQKAC